MKSPIIRWSCGIFAILGLPLGMLVTFESGNPLAGLGSAIAVVFVGLLVCEKDIVRDYKNKKKISLKG